MNGLLSQFAEFAKTPEGQGLLSAAFGGLAGAQRGAPINSIGRAGMAGLAGYSNALDRQVAEGDREFNQKVKAAQLRKMDQEAASDAARAQFLQGLMNPGVAALTEGSEAGDVGPTVTNAQRMNTGTIGAFQKLPQQAVQADLAINGGKNIAEWLFKTGIPDMQVSNGYAFDKNNVQPGFLPGMSVSTDGRATLTMPGPNGLPVVSAPAGALETYGAYRDADERSKSKYDLVAVPQSDGSTRTMPRADAVRVTSGGGTPAQAPQGVITTKGNASITPELYALIQADAAKHGVGEPVLNFSSNTPGAVFGLAGPTVGVSQSPADAARAKADAEAQAGDAAKKSQTRKEFAMNTANNVINTIDSAIDLVGYTTAGPGSLLSGVTGTSARNLAAQLETIKANLGFDRLQQMRDMSPTGGALGSVAVQELTALQSTVSSLDQGQSPEQLKKSLAKIKSHYEKWRDAVVKDAGGGGASADWGDKGVSPAPSKPVPQAAINELKMRKGDPAARQQFDAVFGAGAAARVLGGQ